MISKWGFMSKSYNNILYYIKVANGMSVLSYVVTQISISRLDFYSRNKLQTYLLSKVINLRSYTFGNPIFLKGLTKLATLPDYKRPTMLCLALPARCEVPKLELQSEFSISKIILI